ncbi:hypothetical protein K469DRAFT_572736 [Zopfia rhizophila CBS 207.26]|uniref:Uncharacterized protein n=1 Tax=Zopfia rhizophila CBS 207.26 TaxID=1314779 RepID=A0A6A6E4A8_9PEZI|nr:hypothetical protein K469DRAFT_572736 [Zopfia rhizophila CBS 207.26]
MTSTPSSKTWTLRLKHRKTTILLHVDPLHTFTHIKTTLYNALQETHLTDPDDLSEIPLPSSPSSIIFGRPVDINDPKKGFVLGEWERNNELKGDGGKGKGKAKRKDEGVGEFGVVNVNNCPKGAGLRDGAVLAFRWDEKGRMEEDEDVEMGEREGDMWGVQIPSYEDAYGVENEGDVGGGREFEG